MVRGSVLTCENCCIGLVLLEHCCFDDSLGLIGNPWSEASFLSKFIFQNLTHFAQKNYLADPSPHMKKTVLFVMRFHFHHRFSQRKEDNF